MCTGIPAAISPAVVSRRPAGGAPAGYRDVPGNYQMTFSASWISLGSVAVPSALES